ncbi:MAG: hypothetical protein Q9169_008037 [Polycauliona sp. 2 TL-2023]
MDLPDSGYSEDDTPPSSTHPNNFDHDHISSLEVFSQDLQTAIANSFPRPRSSYTAVHALLLRWAEDDLNVQVELTALKHVFTSQFRFACEQWDIPGRDPTRALQKKLYDFQDSHQGEDELLVVYYGGHGDPDRRGRSIWAANKKPDSPTLNWSTLQHLLETAIPHVLIILDCCYAANAARDTSDGTTKELLAACGRENPTLGIGARSFTTSLIEELQAFGNRPFTAAMLHSRLITMRWRLAFTPVYALLSEHGGHSIELAPQPLPADLGDLEASDDMMDISSPEASIETDTRVMLAVSIADDAICDIVEWKKWLTSSAPWDVTKIEVKVEAAYKSHSTMLITSLPTVAWDTLPNKAAYQFIGFVKSVNLIQVHLHSEKGCGRRTSKENDPEHDIEAVMKQVQFLQRETMSNTEEIAKEIETARLDRLNMRRLIEDAKSNFDTQPRAVRQQYALLKGEYDGRMYLLTQKQALLELLERKQWELNDQTKCLIAILNETRHIVDGSVEDARTQKIPSLKRQRLDFHDESVVVDKAELFEKYNSTAPDSRTIRDVASKLVPSGNHSFRTHSPPDKYSDQEIMVKTPGHSDSDSISPSRSYTHSVAQTNTGQIHPRRRTSYLTSSSKDMVKWKAEEADPLGPQIKYEDADQSGTEATLFDTDATTSNPFTTTSDGEDKETNEKSSQRTLGVHESPLLSLHKNLESQKKRFSEHRHLQSSDRDVKIKVEATSPPLYYRLLTSLSRNGRHPKRLLKNAISADKFTKEATTWKLT